MRYAKAAAAGVLILILSSTLSSQNTPSDRVGGAAQILTADDVRAVLTTAATALGNDTLAAAVVDRTGDILGVYARPGADERTPDIAVSVARTGAMFSNDQAPLSSRTVRFISGTHFPPGIKNTPNAALYGVENINRGCRVDVQGDAAAAIDRNAAWIDRDGARLILPGVEDVCLAGGDADRRQRLSRIVEHRPAAGAAARV